MLPVTPIQHLLFHEAAGRPAGTDWLRAVQPLLLVMTSANPGGEPIVCDSAQALARLAGIADAVLDHDRGIAAACDDSVLRVVDGLPRFLRRSRGYAPAALALPCAGKSVLAWGAYLKTTVCATRAGQAYLSPHVGDLDNAATCRFLEDTAQRLQALLQLRPDAVAHDLQSDAHSTQAAQAFAATHGLPCVAVQHHHAHIAATCAEHGHTRAVLGLALDGVGLGDDGAAWGGELLVVDGARMRRVGHLRPLRLPGGDRAAREPWRMGASVLQNLERSAEIAARWPAMAGAPALAQLLQRGVHCPPSTSAGRWFDAAAALLGLSTHMDYEAQAAMQLEQAAQAYIARHGACAPLAQGWHIAPRNGLSQLDLLPLLGTLADLADPARGAALFHTTLVDALAEWASAQAHTLGLDTVALGGGCFLNALLSTGLTASLRQRGLRVLHPERVSPGDGGIALGQAWVAQQLLENPHACASV
jgi:hydrogenase maturation protein HypF